MAASETDEPLPSGGDKYEVEIPNVTEIERGDRYEGPREAFGIHRQFRC